MKTRQARKAAARKNRTGFEPIMNELHKSGMNHAARRAAKAGWFKSPKAGVAWRKKQWVFGMNQHPRLLDRRCFKITGRYLGELAEASAPWMKAQAARDASKKQNVVRRGLALLGL